MATRQRTVYDPEMVAHLWAHQTQDQARNSSGNVYFSGDTIYSYGSHFPMARHVTGTQGRPAILFTNRTYSVSTARHMSFTRRAIPSGATVFYVNDPCAKPLEWLASVPAEIEKRVLDFIRRRKKGEALHALQAYVDNANHFAEFFGSRKRFALPEGFDLDKAKELAQQAKKRDERQEKKRKAAEEQRRKADYEEALVKLAQWQAGESVRVGYGLEGAFLRVKPGEPETIETTKGAEFPLSHAKRILAAVRSGVPYQHNGHSIRAGVFTIDAIDAEGNVTAGCHYVTREEIERLAKTLGL